MRIANASDVEYGALSADRACGSGTRLIYYMNVGQVLSRTFSSKDTHTLRGDLVVAFTEKEDVDKVHARRAIATTALLGFNAPSFTYGGDLILPSETNAQLRSVLRQRQQYQENKSDESGREETDDRFQSYLASLATDHRYANLDYVEVCLG